jgi:hypothetical protein
MFHVDSSDISIDQMKFTFSCLFIQRQLFMFTNNIQKKCAHLFHFIVEINL